MGIGNGSISVQSGNFSGYNNMAIGNSTIIVNNGGLSGQNNIALGYNSMYSYGDFTGNYNVAIGHNNLINGGSSGITGSHNVAIGSGNYSYILGEGNGNIAILAGNGIDTPGVMDNAIIIGNGSWGALQDGTVAIGNNVSGSPIILGNNANKVGVGGVTTPKTKLDVGGEVRVSSEYGTCTYDNAGAIRFDGAHFYGCDGSTWKQLDN